MGASESAALAELEAQLHAIFAALARGDDVAPAQRYRAEGFARGLIATGTLNADKFAAMTRQVYAQYFDCELAINNAEDCNIPVVMKRAPVYPST